jgi:hypothetical protein
VREFHQRRRTLNVDTRVFVKNSEHDAIHAKLFSRTDIVAHAVKFGIGVTKIAGARTNQNMNGNVHLASSRLHQGRVRGNSSGRQVSAELNPVSATALRRDGVVHRLHTDFQD